MHDGDCTRKRSLSGWSQLILDLIELCPDPLTISNYFYLPMRSRDCKGGSSSKVVEGMFGTERVNSSDRSEKEQPNRVLAQPIIPAVSREKKRKKKRHKQYLRQNQWNTGNSERRTEFQCQMLREDKKILQMRMKVWNERLNFTLQLSRNTRLCWSWNEAMQKKKKQKDVLVRILPFWSFSLPPDRTPLGSMPVGVSPFSVSTLSLSSLKQTGTFTWSAVPFQVYFRKT